MLKIGCCGYGMARGRYFAQFPVVEVQQTFYQPPRPETIARWREEAPADFVFTLKAWQVITHPPTSPTWRRLKQRPGESGYFLPWAAVEAAWERMREAARLLRADVVLFQCPSSFSPRHEHIINLRRFFASADRDGRGFAWEPRGSWPRDLVAELCRELDLIHSVNPLKEPTLTSGTAYFRLHGVTGYRHRHSEDDLQRLRRICASFDEVYCLFNNASMLEDATRFAALAAMDGPPG